ncbi:hypothetical protein SDC9_210131 [bioreactor metagenome]|uniref:Uncharacterized protein n=1 Tax=bioreactor metagenome TaxID=1076179 RepID=A0A645JQ46_9ZZZZ
MQFSRQPVSLTNYGSLFGLNAQTGVFNGQSYLVTEDLSQSNLFVGKKVWFPIVHQNGPIYLAFDDQWNRQPGLVINDHLGHHSPFRGQPLKIGLIGSPTGTSIRDDHRLAGMDGQVSRFIPRQHPRLYQVRR